MQCTELGRSERKLLTSTVRSKSFGQRSLVSGKPRSTTSSRHFFKISKSLRWFREAYMKIFPTAKEFSSPINVCVVGPYPASLERVDDPDDLAAQMQQQAAINTAEVLKAAQNGALDSSLAKVAELVDDLDARPRQQSRRQGSFQQPQASGKPGSTFTLTWNSPRSIVRHSSASLLSLKISSASVKRCVTLPKVLKG